MPPPPPNDQSLLDRLNALKPTGVTLDKLDKPTNTVAPLDAEARAVSKEDALAARLRVLRSQPTKRSANHGDAQDQHASQPSPLAQETVTVEADKPVRPPNTSQKEGESPQPSSATQETQVSSVQKQPSYRLAAPFASDEDALDELLESLGGEDFDFTAEEVIELPLDTGPKDEARKVNDLIESFRRNARRGPSKALSDGDNGDNEDDDDSPDGEQMTRDVETLLSQIRDEISALPPPKDVSEDGDHSPHQGAHPNTASLNTEDDNPFTLPTVPYQLLDPAPVDTPDDDTVDENLSARMASLRGLGSVDALGLPSAPTFRPQDRNTPGNQGSGTGLLRSEKYSDEDQKTWCVVCLEDGVIECMGCDGDMYCARCWKEMHVGPSAGFEERGHEWVKVEKGRRRP
ncbi:uncharacterized protein C8A04DRAFT_24348 [Dichotomopilus funicola]|uniref:Abscission/NoCut checkpoint regulator n=1 Tax=Dichotomopilus funicola TaxID=1934379 RepID=A0AAN6VC07_9PEZI|nr:hypothetical protein C8A04DRAFT_24348 [Dichotomopilus funicola]